VVHLYVLKCHKGIFSRKIEHFWLKKKKNLVSVENNNGQNRDRLLVSTPKMNFRQSLSLASSAVWAEKQRTANTTTR